MLFHSFHLIYPFVIMDTTSKSNMAIFKFLFNSTSKTLLHPYKPKITKQILPFLKMLRILGRFPVAFKESNDESCIHYEFSLRTHPGTILSFLSGIGVIILLTFQILQSVGVNYSIDSANDK